MSKLADDVNNRLKEDTKVSYKNLVIISAGCLAFGVFLGWLFFG